MLVYLLEKLVYVLGEMKEQFFFCAQLPCYLLEKLVWVLGVGVTVDVIVDTLKNFLNPPCLFTRRYRPAGRPDCDGRRNT